MGSENPRRAQGAEGSGIVSSDAPARSTTATDDASMGARIREHCDRLAGLICRAESLLYALDQAIEDIPSEIQTCRAIGRSIDFIALAGRELTAAKEGVETIHNLTTGRA